MEQSEECDVPDDKTCRTIEHNFNYYIKCCFGGIMSCGLTHTAICPVDVVKCKK